MKQEVMDVLNGVNFGFHENDELYLSAHTFKSVVGFRLGEVSFEIEGEVDSWEEAWGKFINQLANFVKSYG